MPSRDKDKDSPHACDSTYTDGLLIGFVTGDYRDFVMHMTEGRYCIPGSLLQAAENEAEHG